MTALRKTFVSQLAGSLAEIPYVSRECARLVSLSGTFTASATVGDRELWALVWDEAGNMVGASYFGIVAATASVEFFAHTLRGHQGYGVGGAEPKYLAPVPIPVLLPGYRVVLTDTAAIDPVGDAWTKCALFVCADDG